MMAGSLAPGFNLWVERDGQVVLSRWRVQLLQTIEETGSISAAARRLDIEYRRAWDKLKEMEAGLGIALVKRQAGGAGGGSARLTDAGHAYVGRFTDFCQGIEDTIARQFRDAFGVGDLHSGELPV